MAEPIAVLDAHGKHAQRALFTADGENLVTCGQDARIRLWKVPGFAPDGAFEGHAACVNTLSFSADGALLASGSSDGTVRIWSFPGGRELDVLDGQLTAAVSPAGGFATISTKARAVLWDGNYDEVATLPLLDRRLAALRQRPRLRLHLCPSATKRRHQNRLYDEQDVLATGVVGAQLRPLGRVQRPLEQRAEDGGLDGSPVEARNVTEDREPVRT